MRWILLIAALFLTVAAISYYTYRIAFMVRRDRQSGSDDFPLRCPEEKIDTIKGLINQFREIPYEDVYIKSYDGLVLHAKYYHVSDSAPLQIQFHGYNGNSIRDFCGGNKIGRDAGHNSLVIDQRAHGLSEGKIITFGIKERRDCLSWIEYSINRFGEDIEIILAGVSMGASTVIMSVDLGLPKNVKCIIADCGYSSPKDILKKVAKDRKLVPCFVYPFIWLGALIFGKFVLTESSAIMSAAKSEIPILIIHGEADDFVPCRMAHEIYDVCTAEKELLLIPGAGHGLSYIVDEASYRTKVNEFINKNIKK